MDKTTEETKNSDKFIASKRKARIWITVTGILGILTGICFGIVIGVNL